jgi:integrase
MKHLNRRANGSYRYLRKYPLRLRSTYSNLPLQYSRELPDINDGSGEEQKFKALANAAKHYELHIKTLSASDPKAFTDTERAMAIEEVLRKKKLRRGEFKDDDQHIDSAFSEIWSIPSDAERGQVPYTFQESVMIDAYFATKELAEVKLEQTFRQAWDNYLKDKLITDVSEGKGKELQQRFERVLAITGDFVINDHTKREVLQRLQLYINVRAEDGIKAQTISRDLKEPMSAIRGVYQLGWADAVSLAPKRKSLKLPAETRPLKGRVLTLDELDLLVDKALNEPDKWLVCFLLQLHAGLMLTEIARLRLDQDVFLDAPVPHILFRGGDEGLTKKEARVRVVPIVLGLEQIREGLPELHKWLNAQSESPNSRCNNKLRQVLNLEGKHPDVKGHSFRHTWVRLATRAEISVRHEQAIGGWSQRDSEINRMLAVVYDPNGFRDDLQLLEQIYKAQKKVFSRWITPKARQKKTTLSNVLPFSGDKS